jgi:cytochrome P450
MEYSMIKEGKLIFTYRQFEREIPKLIFLPDWLARHGTRNRQVVANAFTSYFQQGHHQQASGLVKEFYASEIEYGFSLSDRSLFEVGHALAILGNTSGAVFWLTFYVFSTPIALQEIRKELSTIIGTGTDATGRRQYHIDMAKITTNCPTLVSAFREAVRLHSIGISLRQVCKDTTINDTYHLRKGAMVLMPTDAIHTDAEIWGEDVQVFNHRRFHPQTKHKPPAAAFRTFGGGTTLCPGRHFATTQIMAWTSMLVMQFDMEPLVEGDGNAQWICPTTEKTNLANVMSQPDDDVRVKIITRAEYSDGSWVVASNGNDEMFKVTAEDLA